LNNLAPIVLFVYNRPWHTTETVEALQQNKFAKESELYIYSDAPNTESDEQDVAQVRRYIKTVTGFRKISIVERENNCGLANSIIEGVTEIVNDYGKVIVLEDDLISSRFLIEFLNIGLSIFEARKEIFSIT